MQGVELQVGSSYRSLAYTAGNNKGHEQELQDQALNPQEHHEVGGVPSKKKRRVGDRRLLAAAAAPAASLTLQEEEVRLSDELFDSYGLEEMHDVESGVEGHGLSLGVGEKSNNGELHENGGGTVQGWAPPGLGVCQLWAQQASLLKRKKTSPVGLGVSASFFSSSPSPASPSAEPPLSSSAGKRQAAAVGFSVDDAVPVSRDDKAKLVGGYLGSARPGYGDKTRKPVWWAAEVPWRKGVSISQMNNATLHKLVVAVKAHQRQERREALASGNGFVPDSGLLVCAPKTKKEMSRLIRSIQGRRLQYGKDGKRPPWWPADAPWDSDRPLSTMKHGEVTSIFKAMIREGLLFDTDSGSSSSSSSSSSFSSSSFSSPPSSDSDSGKNDSLEGHQDLLLDQSGNDNVVNGEVAWEERPNHHRSGRSGFLGGDTDGGGSLERPASLLAMAETHGHLMPEAASFLPQQQQQQVVAGETSPNMFSVGYDMAEAEISLGDL
ncbi:unnamed protein product [Ectocarpus sp. CCAP 1310/34]|nr:unnamed protein product [Ectocarpus sp. CCAP 1310/34]